MSDEFPVIDGLRVAPCVRSGHCCKTATCVEGLRRGAPEKGCTFLRGDRPGRYYCGLVEDHPEVAVDLSIGQGCCSPSFNEDRPPAIKQLKRDGILKSVVSRDRFRPGPLAGSSDGASQTNKKA